MVTDHPQEDTFWTSSLSNSDKYKMFHIDPSGSLKIKFDTGEITAHGSLDYFEDSLVIH